MGKQPSLGSVEPDQAGDVHRAGKHTGDMGERQVDVQVAAAAEAAAFDEAVAAWAEAVGVVAVGGNDRQTERRPRRQRRPADVIRPRAPGHPGRRPLAAGHPDPAVARQPHPASIMIAGPAEGFVAAPSPAVVTPQPLAVEVGSPGRPCGEVGSPGVAIAIDLQPAAVRGQRFIKGRIIGCRIHPGLAHRRWHGGHGWHGSRWLAHGWRRRCGCGGGLLAGRFSLGQQTAVLRLQFFQAGGQLGILQFAFAQGGDFRLQLRAARLQIGGGLLQFRTGGVAGAGDVATGQQEQKQGGDGVGQRFHGGNEVPQSLTLPRGFHSFGRA